MSNRAYWNTISVNNISSSLKKHQPEHNYTHQEENSLKNAAILIPFIHKGGSWHILFIRRAVVEGDMHSGQVSFPGGSQEDVDSSSKETALRETYEEIGIQLNKINILGRLNSYQTISNFNVIPWVGEISWPTKFSPSPNEVNKIFTIPLHWLANNKNRETKKRFSKINPSQKHSVIYYSKYEGETLWGFSARVTVDLIDLLNNKQEPK